MSALQRFQEQWQVVNFTAAERLHEVAETSCMMTTRLNSTTYRRLTSASVVVTETNGLLLFNF